MWNLGIAKHLANPNSLSEIHKSKTKKEKLVSLVSRNLKKLWYKLDIEDPIWDLLKELSQTTWKEYNTLDDLDEITLEWLSHNSVATIHELCENVKKDTQLVLEKQQ